MPISFWTPPPAPIAVYLTPRELLAVGAALRIADDDLLTDEGVLPGVLQGVDAAFDKIDGLLTDAFGDDWPGLVVDPLVLAEEYEQGQEGIEA